MPTAGPAEAKPPSGGQMLRRGARRHCPRCGAGGAFEGYFRLRERCPRCGWHFQRDEGFFTGTYLVNFAITEGLLLVVIFAYIFWRATNHHDSPLWLPLTATGVVAVVAPVVFYPFAAGIWLAAELVMRPLNPVEEADALLHQGTDGPPA
jgi:uncharacterized protein (DUF983 family)